MVAEMLKTKNCCSKISQTSRKEQTNPHCCGEGGGMIEEF